MSLPTLTMEALEGPSWEPALTFPFPDNPDIALLFKARDQIIAFLQWLTDLVQLDLAQFDPEKTADEIQRAANRLIEIAFLTPAAVDADIAAGLDIAARFVATQREKSLRGFCRSEIYVGTKRFVDSMTDC
jgi:hypothetical protein